jgi:hypothetical protein
LRRSIIAAPDAQNGHAFEAKLLAEITKGRVGSD